MELVLLRSTGAGAKPPDDRYLQEFDTLFAQRVLGNLEGDAGFCTVCGSECVGCRAPYGRKPGKDVAAVLAFPAVLPYVLEKPAAYLPHRVPRHDVLLAIHIHEQILLEILKVCREWDTKGIVVPLEAPGWISNAGRSAAHDICEAKGLEIAFPKPFCSFAPPKGSVLSQFREHFHIGRPDVRLEVERGKIAKAYVRVSAACGATYCVARWLEGRGVKENLEIEVVSKWWHAYPCTASMERDPELNDETPLHMAGQAHYAILKQVKDRVAGLEDARVKSPLGAWVRKPIPPRENLAKIERAKQLILTTLAERGTVTLAELREAGAATSAALNSAVLLLKREGKVEARGGRIRTAPRASPDR